jgi:hypothetical protein
MVRLSGGTTLSGNEIRLRLPPQAARTVGPPEGADAPLHQSLEAHHPARPLHSPEGATLYSPAGWAAGLGRPSGVRNGAGTGIGHAGG